ncbi:MAG: tetratricopeptide repeat protein [Magnetococcales bacterium]|nr:tetratricopeptide repeat protein [Magnetococcales bacterium]
MRIATLLLGSWFAATPLLEAAPALVQEETLTGRELIGEQPLLSVPLARRLLSSGSPRLVLRVANDVLSRGGAPLLAADWLRLQAEALLLLERYGELQGLLQEMPETAGGVYPELYLWLAASYRESGACEEARKRYSAFLLAYPQHPKRFTAQLGLGLCALEQNSLEEAALQLQLYEQESDRPKQDALWLIAMAELAHRQGQLQEEGRWMGQLAELPLPTDAWQRRERWLRLARWQAGQKHWNAAVAWLESGLRQDGPVPRLLKLHAQLLRQWLAGNDSGALTAEHRQLPESLRRATEQRMNGLRQLLRPDGKGAQEQGRRLGQLTQLLRQAVAEGLTALGAEGGILSAGQLWPGGEWPELYRVAYAEYERLSGDREQAWHWLEGLTMAEAEGERLLLLAGCAENPPALLNGVLDRTGQLRDWPEGLRERAFRALFLLTGQGRQAAMARLRDQLAALTPQSREVQRALSYHQALLWQAEGAGERALLEWLHLAATAGGKTEEERYLPEDPRLKAAQLLEKQGWTAAAQELRRR